MDKVELKVAQCLRMVSDFNDPAPTPYHHFIPTPTPFVSVLPTPPFDQSSVGVADVEGGATGLFLWLALLVGLVIAGVGVAAMVKNRSGGGRSGVRGGGDQASNSYQLAITRSVPKENLAILSIGSSILDTTRDGQKIEMMLYNPKTGTLLLGSRRDIHSDLHHKYAREQSFDDFVKLRI